MARPVLGTPYPRELYHSPVYRAWSDMKTRCTNPRWKQYADYGGRGIRVCERWVSFGNFWEDMGLTWTEGMTLDRIDHNGDYEPGNCRWADRIVQNNNKRNNHFVEFDGQSHTLPEWARIIGIRTSTLSMRYYKYKWSVERCLTEPVRG